MAESKHDLIDAAEAMEIAGEDSYAQFISGVGTIYPLSKKHRGQLRWSRGEMNAAMQQLALRKIADALRVAGSGGT
jgi:hypothetical protein